MSALIPRHREPMLAATLHRCGLRSWHLHLAALGAPGRYAVVARDPLSA